MLLTFVTKLPSCHLINSVIRFKLWNNRGGTNGVGLIGGEERPYRPTWQTSLVLHLCYQLPIRNSLFWMGRCRSCSSLPLGGLNNNVDFVPATFNANLNFAIHYEKGTTADFRSAQVKVLSYVQTFFKSKLEAGKKSPFKGSSIKSWK